MFKGTLTSASVTANTNVPITQVFNTNNKVRLANNSVVVLTSGLWKFDAVINFTASDTTTTVNLLVNGNTVYTTTITTVADSLYQLVIKDAELVRFTNSNTNVDFAIQFGSAVTNVSGVVTTEYVS